MKTMFLAAALMIGGSALAQTPDANTPMGSMGATSPTAPATPDAAPPPTDGGASTTPTTATDPGMSAPASSGMSSSSPGAENYPVCSRTVTDRCVQRGAMPGPKKRR